MATSTTSQRAPFSSCIMCGHLYADPCTLACGHTFCRECLTNFAKSQQEAIKVKSVPCPNCPQLTSVANSEGSVEDWVKEIKPSFIVQGLLDSIEDLYLKNLCRVCLQRDTEVPGTSTCNTCDINICEKCVDAHRATPTISQHDIVKISGKLKMRRKRKVRCTTHNTIPLTYYCKDCQKALCETCRAVSHKNCDTVWINWMVPDMKDALEKKKAAMTQQSKMIKTGLEQRGKTISEIEARKLNLYSEIRKVSQKAINIIKQKEKQLEDKLKGITESQIEELKSQMREGESDLQMYEQHCEFIDQAVTAESEMDMYEMCQMYQTGAVRLSVQNDTDHSPTSSKGEITFEEEFNQQKMTCFVHLGSLNIRNGEFDPKCIPVLVDRIDIRIGSDKKVPDPIDVTVLDVDGFETLVVTDYSNECIKSFYTINKQVHHSSIKLKRAPWSITRLNPSLVVVSSLTYTDIVMARVTPSLILISQFMTRKRYRCLTALSDTTLVGGCGNPPSLDIIDLTGRVLKSITSGGVIQMPWFLSTTNSGNILVTDYRTKSVHCLTQEGDVVFTYPACGDRLFSSPRGITTSTSGDILVVDRDESRLVQLTSTGHFVRDMLTSRDCIYYPYSICLHNHTLYVTQDNQPLKVFRLKKGK